MITIEKLKQAIEYLQKDKAYNELENKINNEIILKKYNDYKQLDCIFDNNHFLIEYDEKVNEFVLSTSFSNQIIDSLFINTMNILVIKVKIINTMINRIS